jgi:hypothetical protein
MLVEYVENANGSIRLVLGLDDWRFFETKSTKNSSLIELIISPEKADELRKKLDEEKNERYRITRTTERTWN